MERGCLLAKAGLESSLIYTFLFNECIEKNIPISFTKEDIYNSFIRANSDIDCSNVVSYLQDRFVQNDLLRYDVYVSEDGVLDRLFSFLRRVMSCSLQVIQRFVCMTPSMEPTDTVLKLGCL